MFWHIVSIRRSYMRSESLWQGIIMDKTIQNMAKIREEIQSRNQEKKYDVNEMPEVAQMILDRLGIEEVPIPIVAIMKSLNFQVVAGELKDEISGIIGIDDDLAKNFKSSKVIAINNKDNVGHQRFTMAHELAHYLFDFDVSNQIVYYNTYNTFEDENEEERRANYFAANLLMPEKKFKKEFDNVVIKNNLYVTVEKLSQIFQVSGEAVRRRISELSLQV